MSQHDFNIANQLTPNHRADLNNALVALATNSSGGTEPTTTYANMFWYDSSANTLKIRNEADSDWISLGYVDQSTGKFNIFDDTVVVDASGVQQNTLGGGSPILDQQTFTSSGTWTKPSEASTSIVKVQVWGGGGGGATDTAGIQAGGGGGGAYNEFWCTLADLGSTESVTIGAGGAGSTLANGYGSNGGSSYFGLHVGAGGGTGGRYDALITGGIGGRPLAYVSTANYALWSISEGLTTIFNGGRGGNNAYNSNRLAGASVWGGGGGAAGSTLSTYALGGSVNAGDGGYYASDGDFPAGGGGGADGDVNDAGSGGDGYAVVTVYEGV